MGTDGPTNRVGPRCIKAGRAEPQVASGWPTPAGLRALLPGYAQWSWGQRERGLVLFGGFASASVSAAFAWGSPLGAVLLVFAFGTHLVSIVDALRQSTFPAAGRWAHWLTAGFWLGLTIYAPVLAVTSVVAWPGVGVGSTADGYLVNCWAYLSREPERGEWVWFHSTPSGDPRLGRVVAGGGQDIQWAENRLRVDGGAVDLPAPSRSVWPPRLLSYKVPEGHVLINSEGDRREVDGMVIVDRGQVVGRAWARYYPVLERRLLD